MPAELSDLWGCAKGTREARLVIGGKEKKVCKEGERGGLGFGPYKIL